MSKNPLESEAIATPPFLIRRNQQIRNLILDYAMGAALIGLNPFRGTLTLTLLVVGVLILKMIWDIGSNPHFSQRELEKL